MMPVSAPIDEDLAVVLLEAERHAERHVVRQQQQDPGYRCGRPQADRVRG